MNRPTWSGSGLARLGFAPGQTVDQHDLGVLLTGRHPVTGERVITAQGSNGRRHMRVGQPTVVLTEGTDREFYNAADAASRCGVTVEEFLAAVQAEQCQPTLFNGLEMFSLNDLEQLVDSAPLTEASAGQIESNSSLLSASEAAKISGFSISYLTRVCRESQTRDPDGPGPYLRAHKAHGTWQIQPGDLAQFMRNRKAPSTRACFDVTFSMEKSVSILGLLSEPDIRRQVTQTVLAANQVGLDHLNLHASKARVKGRSVETDGLAIASYLHTTSRADDPNLHVHNIVLNTVRTEDHLDRAVDATGLYLQAATASHLATAQLRYDLTAAYGVKWVPVPGSRVFEIDGISPEQIARFSKRKTQVENALNELLRINSWPSYLSAKDNAVLTTRPAKTGEDSDVIRAKWNRQAQEIGLTPQALRDLCQNAAPPPPLSPAERRELLQFIYSEGGATEKSSVFVEADVAAAILRWVPEDQDHARVVSTDEMISVITDFFDLPTVVPVINAQSGAAAKIPHFTTRRSVQTQDMIQNYWLQGMARTEDAFVEPHMIDETLTDLHEHTGIELTVEQTNLVKTWCSSGHRFQSAVGRPGTGKTFTCAAAVATWRSAGYEVYGAAVKGEAARLLGNEANIESETLRSTLNKIGRGDLKIGKDTILLIDEASTISDDELHELMELIATKQASVRFIGDPAQHSSVPAGGMWEHLTTRFATHTPELTHTRRMVNPHDIDAAEHARLGQITQAFNILDQHGQLTQP